MQLQSTRVSLDDEYAVMQHFWEQGWTDGLPIVAPTPDRVEAFLAAAGLEPEAMVGAYQTRATALTAEKLAVNAVMAGCKPEYMPVLVAAFEGLTDPVYRMNHMASLGSPWPLIIVNGPIVKEIGMTTGQYVMGGGNHANATIGRAVSLTMANCFGAKVGGVQRGCLGNPNRWSFCIAENEDTPWTPLHAQRGFQAEESAVTVFGSMNGFDQFVTPNFNEPVFLCELMAQRIANGFFTLGSYVVVMAPTYQQHFLDAGWSKDDVTRLPAEARQAFGAQSQDRWALGALRHAPLLPAAGGGAGRREPVRPHAPRRGVPQDPVARRGVAAQDGLPDRDRRRRGGQLRRLPRTLPAGHRAGDEEDQDIRRRGSRWTC